MKIAIIILAILGGLTSIVLGMKWQGDFNAAKAIVASLTQSSDQLGGALNAQLDELKSLVTASWFLIFGGLLSIIAGFVAIKKAKIAGVVLLLCCLCPVFFSVKTLLTTFLIGIAGILALLKKDAPKVTA